MKPSDIRNHVSQQCGFNSGVETPRTVGPNGSNETGEGQREKHELGLYAICKKCGAWPIATGSEYCNK